MTDIYRCVLQSLYAWLLPIKMRKFEAVRMPGVLVIVAGTGKGFRSRYWLDDPINHVFTTEKTPRVAVGIDAAFEL